MRSLGTRKSPHEGFKRFSTLNVSSCNETSCPPIWRNDWRSDAFDVCTHGPRQLLRATILPLCFRRHDVLLMNFSNAGPSAAESNKISDGLLASRGTYIGSFA